MSSPATSAFTLTPNEIISPEYLLKSYQEPPYVLIDDLCNKHQRNLLQIYSSFLYKIPFDRLDSVEEHMEAPNIWFFL